MIASRATTRTRLGLLAALMLEVACRSGPCGCSESTPAAKRGGSGQVHDRTAPGRPSAARPARIVANQGVAQGVLLALHGYGDTGANFVEGFGLVELARREGWVLVVPEGTPDRNGNRFWNATDACCNFFDADIDDVAYLRGLLEETAAAYRVDARRRYVFGFSNGAFMAHRLACEAADAIAAIVTVSGTTWENDRCRPRSPVSVLQVHGDADPVIRFAGGRHVLGQGKGDYPGAVATVERWARLDGCSGKRTAIPPLLDLEGAPGAETVMEQVAGCPEGVDVRLLTVRGAPHVPAFTPAFIDQVGRWLKAQTKVTGPERAPGSP
jgi:polyhydroxybutyrate depolymerase